MHELTAEEVNTERTYDKIAPEWSKGFGAIFELWRSEFEMIRSLFPGNKIIDLGCGNGRDAHFFLSNEYDYIGIDISAGMLAEAKKQYPTALFQRMSLYELDFEPDSFDGFWAVASLWHIPKADITLVLNEIKRVVKTGAVGFIIMAEGDGEGMENQPGTENETFVAFWREKELTSTLETNGFKVIKCLPDENLLKYTVMVNKE